MIDEYKVYKARVTKVTPPDEDGAIQRQIFVSPIRSTGMGTWERPASPPTVVPTSLLGSGSISFPVVGQECLVAESGGQRHILCYTQPKGISSYGLQIPETYEEGEVGFTVSGIEKTSLRLTRSGLATLFSNEFSRVEVDGVEKSVKLKGYRLDKQFAGGFERYGYNKEDFSTSIVKVYTDRKDIGGFSDVSKRVEQGNAVPLPYLDKPYLYADKTVYKYGNIPGESITYYRDTRQSVNPLNSYDKNVITTHRVGYQEQHTRFDTVTYPEGTIYEFTAKKNLRGDVASFVQRYGRLKTGAEAGEIYRIHIQEGLNNNIPFGTPIANPVGEGEGYSYTEDSDASFSYLQSVGELNGSLFREIVQKKGLTGSKTAFSHKIGEFGAYWHVTTSDNIDKLNIGEGSIKLENNSGTSITLQGESAVINASGGGVIKISEKGSITLSKGGDLELVKLVQDLADALFNTTSPGYGAPLPTKAQFKKISQDLESLRTDS